MLRKQPLIPYKKIKRTQQKDEHNGHLTNSKCLSIKLNTNREVLYHCNSPFSIHMIDIHIDNFFRQLKIVLGWIRIQNYTTKVDIKPIKWC